MLRKDTHICFHIGVIMAFADALVIMKISVNASCEIIAEIGWYVFTVMAWSCSQSAPGHLRMRYLLFSLVLRW